MIVGEAPGEDEIRTGVPFTGQSGQELTRMLHEAGIARSECFLTNVCRERPRGNDISQFIAFKKNAITRAHVPLRDKMVLPVVREGYELLKKEIALVKPNVIIALGNTASWALTGKWGVTDWRGSELFCDQIRFEDGSSPTVIPSYHPAAILRQWSWRPIAVHDFRKAYRMAGSRERVGTDYNFIIRPSYPKAVSVLAELLASCEKGPFQLSVDIETRAGHIACIGFAWSERDAISIPLMLAGSEGGYWRLEEEEALVARIRSLLTHPNCKTIGQNFSYDAQYIARHWLFLPICSFDTMLAQHACFSNLPKDLGFLSSMYCKSHVFWKNDGKTWDASTGEEQLWTYNCTDCVRTYEIAQALSEVISKMGLEKVNEFQQSLFGPVMRTIQRGVCIDTKRRSQVAMALTEAIDERLAWLKDVCGQELNPRSNTQMYKFVVEDLKQKPVLKRRAKGDYTPSFDDESLTKIAAKEPLLRPIFRVIADIRSLGVFLSTFIEAPLDFDKRMRCAYNIGGTVTYRFSSSESAFGVGTNLQNIPKGDE